jgi:hypothetical protein
VIKRQRIFFAVSLASALLMTGCASHPGSGSRPSAHHAVAQPGHLLAAIQGKGNRTFSLPGLATGGSRATLKLSCAGPGTATVTDASGGLVLHIGGCPGNKFIYTVAWTSTSKDQALKLATDAGSSWRLAVWAKN